MYIVSRNATKTRPVFSCALSAPSNGVFLHATHWHPRTLARHIQAALGACPHTHTHTYIYVRTHTHDEVGSLVEKSVHAER